MRSETPISQIPIYVTDSRREDLDVRLHHIDTLPTIMLYLRCGDDDYFYKVRV